ncbi:MAG: CxxH/CxxC protein [Bacillaceae bacterium]|nr:CxxH/CxxC protein [Bacillaceae bacterium]
MEKMLASCQSHLEQILDDFVDEFEEAPDVVRLEDMPAEENEVIEATCRYCGRKAIVFVKSCRKNYSDG